MNRENLKPIEGGADDGGSEDGSEYEVEYKDKDGNVQKVTANRASAEQILTGVIKD